MTRSGDFDLALLAAALDEQRRARDLTWSEVAKQISNGLPIRGIATATISGVGARGTAEADGVLQMLRWLERSPESFVPGALDGVPPPEIPEGKILRFDTRALHAALDARRNELGRTWADLGRELGVGPASLTGLARGGRTAFPQVMRFTGWLGRPAADFTRVSDR